MNLNGTPPPVKRVNPSDLRIVVATASGVLYLVNLDTETIGAASRYPQRAMKQVRQIMGHVMLERMLWRVFARAKVEGQ